MKHAAPETFENRHPVPPTIPAAPLWRQRLARWWRRAGWDRDALPEAMRRDVEGDHPGARPVRGRAGWERRL